MPWPMFWPGHKKIKAGDRVAGGRIEDIGLKWWQREIVHSGSSITLPVRWPLDQYQLPILILKILAESCGISDSCWGPYYWISGMEVLLISVKAWPNFKHVRLSVEGARICLFLQWCEPAWLVAIIERQESVVMVRPTLLLASASSHSPFVLTGPAAAAAATRHWNGALVVSHCIKHCYRVLQCILENLKILNNILHNFVCPTKNNWIYIYCALFVRECSEVECEQRTRGVH